MVNNPLRSVISWRGWHWGPPLDSRYVWKSAKQIRSVTYLGKDFAYVPFWSLFGCFLSTDYLGVEKNNVLNTYIYIYIHVFFVMFGGYIYSTPLSFVVQEKRVVIEKRSSEDGKIDVNIFSGPILFPHRRVDLLMLHSVKLNLAKFNGRMFLKVIFRVSYPLLLRKFQRSKNSPVDPMVSFWWGISD